MIQPPPRAETERVNFPSLTPLALKRSCAKNQIAYIIAIACAKIGIIPLAGIVFCYLNSCHFYFTEIETFIDTWTVTGSVESLSFLSSHFVPTRSGKHWLTFKLSPLPSVYSFHVYPKGSTRALRDKKIDSFVADSLLFRGEGKSTSGSSPSCWGGLVRGGSNKKRRRGRSCSSIFAGGIDSSVRDSRSRANRPWLTSFCSGL